MLGVRVDTPHHDELPEILRQFLSDQKQHAIFTPNPEMLVLAQKDPVFLDIMNASDLNVPDGFGLVLASKFLDGKRLDRITGVETLELLAKLCAKEGKKLMLIGGRPGIAERAAENLQKRFQTYFVRPDEVGKIRFFEQRWEIDTAVIDHIKHEGPDVLAVALGHGKQERFIHDFLHKLPSVKIAIGIGGALDYLSGTVPRAPLLMRKMGLEWLFRLVRDPKRLPRIWNAVVVFPWVVIRARMRGV